MNHRDLFERQLDGVAVVLVVLILVLVLVLNEEIVPHKGGV
jgi:hypothetical protein